MDNNLQISAQVQKSVLSKEQKRYNSLLSNIKKIQKQIEETRKVDIELRKLGEALVMPAEKKVFETLRTFVIQMDKSPFAALLKKNQSERYHAIIEKEAGNLLDTSFFSDDEEIIALYDKHSESTETWQEQMEAQEEEELDFAAFMANQMFGMDLDAEDMKDPEKMMEKVRAFKEKMMAEHDNKRQTRKKTNKQLEAEANRKQAEQAVNKTAKQIYHDLVKHFHPDKETDEKQRAQKTEIMKEITAAYEANNHLKLMELQMNLLAGENVFTKFDDYQLRYFNDILKKQKDELEMELQMSSPDFNGNIYGQFFDLNPRVMNGNIKRHVQHQERNTAIMETWLSLIRTKEGFKDLVKNYELEDELDDIFFDPDLFFDFFRSNGRH